MCGRFTLFESSDVLSKDFSVPITFGLTPRYNVAPSQPVLSVRVSLETRRREASWLRWGLIPRWAKDASIGYRMINARAETVAEKPGFRDAFRHRRCLVPSSGFYEWKKEGVRKQPHFIRRKDSRPFAFAGLWEQWKGTDEAPVESCTLVTTEANELVSSIHDRMPVILQPSDYKLWLDPEISDRENISPLLRQYPAQEMEAFPVGTIVNNPKVEDPRCIVPV